MRTNMVSACRILALLVVAGLAPLYKATYGGQLKDDPLQSARGRVSAAGLPASANQIIGREVTDKQGHKIGVVRELAVDARNGRIAEVIVGTGGFLRFQERESAVPPDKFFWDQHAKRVVLRIDPEEIRNAPTFDLARWADSTSPERIREIYERFQVTPYFTDETTDKEQVKAAQQLTASQMVAPQSPLGPIERASRLLGRQVVGPTGDKIGRVDDIIVNLSAGRIVVAIVSTGEFLDMGSEVSAIPMQAMQYEPVPDEFRLNETPVEMRVKPHYKPNDWPGVANPHRVAMVYNAYHLPVYQDFPKAAFGASDLGVSPSDRAITERIRNEIMARPELSEDAQYITIITVDGQVTLRGLVQSRTEEQAIITIARAAAAQNAKVSNRMQTSGAR